MRTSRPLRRILALTVVGAGTLAPTVLAAPAAHADAVRAAQWPISFLNLPAAWQTTRGAGITVAVLDTGVVPDRPDLAGQVTTGPDLVGGGKAGDADWGVHGTGMASIIAGHGHGAGRGDGVVGVAPEAKILSVRVIRDDDARRDLAELTHTPISQGIRYAVDHGAQVISMSLGGTTPGAESDATNEAEAVRYAVAHGVSIVVSAGNSGEKPDQDVTMYPAGERGVIAVAAVDRNARRAPFSSTGWDVAVAAPGVDIPMALPIDDRSGSAYADWGAEIGSGTLVADGTSPACAYAAGVVALVRSAYPKLSPQQVAEVVKTTASHRPAGGRDDFLGNGIVDPVAALKAAARLTPDPATPVTVPPADAHFGYGPAVAARQSSGGVGPTLRGVVDAGIAVLVGAAVAGWLVLRGRRVAPSGPVAGPSSAPFPAPQPAVVPQPFAPQPFAPQPLASPSFAPPPFAVPRQPPAGPSFPAAEPLAAPQAPGPVPTAAVPPTTLDSMTDFAGRTIAPSAFPSDDGSADPALLAVLEAHRRGHAEIERAYGYLLNARVLAPIVAVLGEAEEVADESGRTLRRDKNSDMALVTLVAPDGTRALPVFTSVEALTGWNPEARPMPVAFPRACAAAKAEGATVVLVDLGRPSYLEVEPAAVRAFAGVLEQAEQAEQAGRVAQPGQEPSAGRPGA